MARLHRTSPYQLYQYFINVADADVLLALRFLSDVDEAEYRSLEGGMSTQPGVAQRRLAQSVTKLVHGEAGWHQLFEHPNTCLEARSIA